MVSIVIAIVGLGLLVVLHEGGHYLAARLCGMRVERFSIGFGPTLLGFKHGGTMFQIAPIPLGGFVQITGLNPNEEFDHNDPHVYPNRPRWMRFFTIVAGPLANFITAIVVMLFVYTILGVPMPSKYQRLVTIVPDSAAAAAGLKKDDVVLEVDGHEITPEYGVSDHVKKVGGVAQVFKVLRAGKTELVTVTPRRQSTGQFLIGVGLEPEHFDVRVLPLGEAAKAAAIYPIEKSQVILVSLYNMVTGKEKGELSGPIGITREIAKAASHGALDYFGIIAMLSVYLGLFNLLPLPALDGGRALFLGLEALIRRRINPRIEATVHTVGLVVLLGVLLLVSFKDFTRLIGKG